MIKAERINGEIVFFADKHEVNKMIKHGYPHRCFLRNEEGFYELIKQLRPICVKEMFENYNLKNAVGQNIFYIGFLSKNNLDIYNKELKPNFFKIKKVKDEEIQGEINELEVGFDFDDPDAYFVPFGIGLKDGEKKNASEATVAKQETPQNKGLRYNKGKPAIALIPSSALKAIGDVLDYGATKYTTETCSGKDNWRKGLSWRDTAGSALRHIAAYLEGEDFDDESGLYHLGHAGANIAFLLEFYKTYPQGDDRPHRYLRQRKIGLDIDEVLCDWVSYWTSHYNQELPDHWIFDREIKAKFEEKKDDKEFWLSIPPLFHGSELPFEPVAYVTRRPIPNEWTMEWLDKNGFPHVPCVTIDPHGSKLETLKQYGVTEYVDDNFDIFCDLNRNGIACWLMDAKHNRKYDVGYKRIKSLRDIF